MKSVCMPTACFTTSNKANVVVFEHKYHCFESSEAAQEHSIEGNTWISSNRKNIHAWHVSLPIESQCKIGIISNEMCHNQTYLFKCCDLRSIILTLDLKSTPACLYYVQNGASSRNIICNNIPKGNNVKYKFIITKINSLCTNESIQVLKELINDTCLFENYDLNSISSITKFVGHTSNCLVYGYMPKNNIEFTIPEVIKELCLCYFVGRKFMQDVREELLCDFEAKPKIKLYKLILNIIYPGNKNVASRLKTLVECCHPLYVPIAKFHNPRRYDEMWDFDNFHQQRKSKSLYLSILISLTNVIDFYQTLSQIESAENYNEIIVKQEKQLVYKLLKQNSKYYPLYLGYLLEGLNLRFNVEQVHSDQYLSSIISNILARMQSLDFTTSQDSNLAIIALEILYVVIETNDLDIKYEITNLDNLIQFTTIALRSNESSIIGWKILNVEINKLLGNKYYRHYNNWIVYIESKCGLFQNNLVHNINIIKNKCNGNKENAQKQLVLANKTCYNINQLQSLKLKKFAALYEKINKTKLLIQIAANSKGIC